MLKYTEYEITFREIPDEITLCINISGCPNRCPECHSKHLWEDIGEPLNLESLHKLIDPCKQGISCVALMGGDQSPAEINYLTKLIKVNFSNVRVAWYSGREQISDDIDRSWFDYIKIGPYKSEFGPLDSKTTNQRLYRVIGGELKDITNLFWTHA